MAKSLYCTAFPEYGAVIAEAMTVVLSTLSVNIKLDSGPHLTNLPC